LRSRRHGQTVWIDSSRFKNDDGSTGDSRDVTSRGDARLDELV